MSYMACQKALLQGGSTASVHVVLCRNLCYGLPRVHEIDVAAQLRLNGGQLLHALLHLQMKLQDKPQHCHGYTFPACLIQRLCMYCQ